METGITTTTENRIVTDAGALYRDYGETSQEKVGATRGGATFTVERDDREIEVDGTKGPTKGLKRTIRHTARLEVTLVEVSEQTLIDLTRGTSVSNGTHRTVTPDNVIASADYFTNLALAADVQGTTDPIVIKLLNGLVSGEWSITTDDDDEGEVSLTIEAHYDIDDLDDPPYRILLPVSAT